MNVSMLVVTLDYSFSFIRGDHWGKLGKWNKGFLCIIFLQAFVNLQLSQDFKKRLIKILKRI